jgi:hypothetical protein
VRRVALLLFLAACGGGSDGGGATAPPVAACAEGFTPDADGACAEIAAASCAPGTMPVLGHPDCQPVGWTDACPAGWKADPSGWGCIDTTPKACPAGQRNDVAKAACVPVGDCDAPFPPPGATLFVDPNGPSDATHFTAIAPALTASKDGDVVAVGPGTYTEIVDVPVHPITILGKCAAQVVVKAPAGNPKAGVYVAATTGVTIRGLTLTGFPGAVLLEQGELVLEDSVIDASTQVAVFLKLGSKLTMRRSVVANTTLGPVSKAIGGGIVAYDGSKVLLEDDAITDNYFRNLTASHAGTAVTATNVYFARNTAIGASEPEANLGVDQGASLTLAQSVVTDSLKIGITAQNAGTSLSVDKSVVRHATGSLAASTGEAVYLADSANATITSSAVTDNGVLGVYVDTKATLQMASSVVRGPTRGTKVDLGRGLQVVGGAAVDVKGTAFVELPQSGIGLQFGGIGTFERVYVRGAYAIPEKGGDFGGFGLLAENPGTTATITDSTFEEDQLAALSSNIAAAVTAEGVLVRNTRELPLAGAGSGVQISQQGRLSAKRSAIVGSAGSAALVIQGGVLRLEDGVVRGTLPSADGSFGHGISVFADARVDLVNETLSGNANVALVAAGGSASVARSTFSKNTVALHAQDGSTIVQSDVPPDDLGTGELRVSSDTKFLANGARIGAGEIPVPTPLTQ